MNTTKLIADNNEHGGALMIVNGRKCSMASVRSYTEYNNAIYGENCDPEESIANAKARGHDLFWINLQSLVISGDKGYYEREEARWANAPRLNVGDLVEFEGNTFRIAAAPNNNFRPVAV
jgi:hypothetical protein